MLYEFREDAVIMNSDLMYFLEAIEEDRQTVKRIFNARHNYVARRVSQISLRDDDKMKMRNRKLIICLTIPIYRELKKLRNM